LTRLFVTGVGLVTSIGATRETTWKALLRGERGIRPIDLFDTSKQRANLGAQVDVVTIPDVGEGGAAAWSRSSAMAFAAAREALAEAKIDPKTSRIGLVVGGTTGGMFETEARLAELHSDPEAHEALLEMLSHPLTSTGDRLDETLGPFARVRTLSSACSSGANALIVAAEWLRAGVVDAVVAGGSDGLCRLTLSGFNALAAIDPALCKPFDRSRKGLNIGEGAGFLVLERASSARERRALPIAELAGWAIGSEAHHITNPEPTGASAGRTISAALARARLQASHVDYVNAHGTGTPLNDPMEAAALALALGDELRRIPVSSSKGQIGHTLGAAGGIEAGIAALTIARQAIVPTAGLVDPDPACPLVHVRGEGRAARVRATISNSFGFGGMDTALVFTEPELAPEHDWVARRVVVTAAATLTPSGLRGTVDSRALLDPNAPDGGRRVTLDLGAMLDVSRARRLDRAARMGAVVIERALEESGAKSESPTRIGAVVGSAFGSVDASAAFMHRLFEKGPRMVSPAEFPNLVPSSPAGHVSIYLGLRGPVLATADLATSGESACAQAIELIADGEADTIVAGGLEEASQIVERRLVALFSRFPATSRGPRAEGGAVIVFEAEETVEAAGRKIIARVEQLLMWREPAELPLGSLRAPGSKACVFLAREDEGILALIEASPWRGVRRAPLGRAPGEHEGLGAMAIAAAVSEMQAHAVGDALVVGLAKGRGYALRLVAR
jgi:3-oxoacyl-[acyl-carrier-protein] synthase II